MCANAANWIWRLPTPLTSSRSCGARPKLPSTQRRYWGKVFVSWLIAAWVMCEQMGSGIHTDCPYTLAMADMIIYSTDWCQSGTWTQYCCARVQTHTGITWNACTQVVPKASRRRVSLPSARIRFLDHTTCQLQHRLRSYARAPSEKDSTLCTSTSTNNSPARGRAGVVSPRRPLTVSISAMDRWI